MWQCCKKDPVYNLPKIQGFFSVLGSFGVLDMTRTYFDKMWLKRARCLKKTRLAHGAFRFEKIQTHGSFV